MRADRKPCSNAPIIDVATDVCNGLWIYDKQWLMVTAFVVLLATIALRDFMVNYFGIVKAWATCSRIR